MDILKKEAKGCFDFFWNEISTSKETYGLIRDNNKDDEDLKDTCSIASVGFGLAAICVGVHMGFTSYNQGYERCLKTMDTLQKLPHLHGFFYHFSSLSTGKGKWGEEFSIIDTSILLMGALCASEFFKGEVSVKFEEIYQRVDWDFYLNSDKNAFFMGYNNEGGFGLWDMCAEQTMIYFLSSVSPLHPVSKELFYKLKRKIGQYKTDEFIFTPVGALFPYQFSHAFLDLREKKDRYGVDWFENSIQASLANYHYCVDHQEVKGMGQYGWGLTACQGKDGYKGAYGTLPSDGYHICDGTIPPCGALGSLVFTPMMSIRTVEYYKAYYPDLWGKYGFQDAFNIHLKKPWFCDFVIGIDKGISLLMISNYYDGFIWELTSRNNYIKKAFHILGFKSKV